MTTAAERIALPLAFYIGPATTLCLWRKAATMKSNETKEVTTMRLILKILLAPIIAALTIFIWITAKLVQVAAIVLNFIAVAIALGAFCILLDGKTAQGVAGLIAAFLLTPFGLPLLSLILLEQVRSFKSWIQDCVYG